jgi:Flp pilus assembly protein TadD
MAGNRKNQLASAALVGLILLAGCETTEVAKHNSPYPAEENPAVKLSAKQVADMQVAMAQSMEKRGETEQAKQTYLTALMKDPTRADACVKLANLHARRGEFAEATGLYRRAMELEPSNADLYCSLGYSHYLQEQWVEADAALRQCLKLQPNHKRAHNNLGLVLARRRQDNEALAQFRLAGCGEADARLNLAYAQTLGQDFDAARSQYEKVLALDSSSEPARKGLDRVALLTKKLAGEAGPALAKKDLEPPSAPHDLNETAIRLSAAKEEQRRMALRAIEAGEEAWREPSPFPLRRVR